MASYEQLSQPRERANSFPENVIRKVTIQQAVIQPANASVALTNYVDHIRRYPKVEYHDPSNRGHRGKRPVKPTRGTIIKSMEGLELKNSEERNTWETTSRTGERDLWQKAVKELELVIAEKDTAIENLSKVNIKLSGDIQWYEKSLLDCKESLKNVEDKLEQATADNRDKAWHEKVLKEREGEIKELEETLKQMAKPAETRDKRSLELTQGAKSVLKNLEVMKEKNQLERKVEALEEQLKQQMMESKRQELVQNLDDNKLLQKNDTSSQEIKSSLKEFQLTIEKKLNKKMQLVTDFDNRLSRCIFKFKTLAEKVKSASASALQHVQETVFQESSLQVPSLPELSLEDMNSEEHDPGNVNLNDVSPPDVNAKNLKPQGQRLRDHDEQVNNLKKQLLKERKINDEIIERFLELEESIEGYEGTIAELQAKANLVENLRTQNKKLADEISEIQERENYFQEGKSSLTDDQDTVDGIDESEDSEQNIGTESDIVTNAYEEQINALRSIIESHEDELRELREKAAEDDELIEELRANFQREEKWNREIQRKYEWELTSNARKDDRIEEIEDCLWVREKAVKQLREQLEFEDKRCEELLEKLVASQNEAQEFEITVECLQKKLQDKEKRIIEFCEQNDRDAASIASLSSENKHLQNEIENLTKTRKSLEEDLEKLNRSVEITQQNKEEVVMGKNKDLEEISIQLKEEELRSKSKDEVITKLQENVESLSENVREIEFRMEESKGILEEEIRQAQDNLDLRKRDLTEASERYKELEEVCKSLREKISQKEDQIIEREADIASQREVIESGEKQLEEFREICGDTFKRINNKPPLVYTEAEMNEVNQFLEQEKEISEQLRTRVKLLEKELISSNDSFLEMKRKLDSEIKAQKETITTTRMELKARNNLLEKTRGELHAIRTELERQGGVLISKEKEFEESLEVLRCKVDKMDNEKQLLQKTVAESEQNLMLAMNEIQILTKRNQRLKGEIGLNVERVKRADSVNKELREDLEKLTAKCLGSEEELKLARENNVNLKHSLEDYISQSQEQTRNLKSYEQEVETLREHIQEMNVVINDFRSALEAAVKNEKTNEDRSAKNVDHQNSVGSEHSDDFSRVRGDGAEVDTRGTSTKNRNSMETVSLLGSEDKSAAPTLQQHPSLTLSTNSGVPCEEIINRYSHSDKQIPETVVASQNDDSIFFFKKPFRTLLNSSIPHNRILFFILGFLVFVFLFGCMSTSIISRKYLFVFANSIISLTMFVLWRDEVRRNKQFKVFSPNSLHERRPARFRENGYLLNNSNDLFSECQHCENNMSTGEEERLHFRKIKSSFQELHGKFLEAVENSSKDTLPIQELYNDYEKLKDEVEGMRMDRLDNDYILSPLFNDEKDSEKESLLAPKWKRVVLNLGRVLMIVFLCEMFYIRGTSFSHLASQLTFFFSCLTFSYVFDYFGKDNQTVETHIRQNATQFAQEIDELNEIIDREHQLVTTQREAIKVLEKRLKKEFERRIKQRNVLLKKLKYKGKLEDLRELLEDERDNEDKTEHAGVNLSNKWNKNLSKNQMVSRNTESDPIKKLHDILSNATQRSLTSDLAFSPMFFFLGVPLTGIMLSCRYLILAALMTLTQITVFLKESKFIEVERFPKVFRKEIHPVIMDTVVVLFACLLAVGLHCSQGIMVLITCSIVQLSVYWWNSYKLAKSENILNELLQNCIPGDRKEAL